jgi:hypothetical protein
MYARRLLFQHGFLKHLNFGAIKIDREKSPAYKELLSGIAESGWRN